MSSHFAGARVMNQETRWSKIRRVVFWKPSSTDERAWAHHCYFRALCAIAAGIYFAYWHPEYSVISAWWHGTNEPIVHRAQPFNPSDYTNYPRASKLFSKWTNTLVDDRSGVTPEAESDGSVVRDDAANHRSSNRR